jgi:hypothetical protein
MPMRIGSAAGAANDCKQSAAASAQNPKALTIDRLPVAAQTMIPSLFFAVASSFARSPRFDEMLSNVHAIFLRPPSDK